LLVFPAVDRGPRGARTLSNLSELKENIGRRIRAVREARGLGLDALKDEYGTLSGTVGRIERGESDARLSTLLRLMRILSLESIEELLGELPPSMPSKMLGEYLATPNSEEDLGP